MSSSLGWLVCVTVSASLMMAAESPQGYYRQPSIRGDVIVFVAEGDLWSVAAIGGTAKRLTTHAGDEGTPSISPDGSQIAFTAQYEGPTEVYVMPAAGGLPTRLTWDASRASVSGWRGNEVIAATQRFSTLPAAQLSLIDPASVGAKRELLPLSQAAEGAYDDTGKTLFFTRLQFQGSHTKRYKGGTAQNLWKYADGEPEAVPLTADFPGTSASPMWWKGRLYFNTDRDGTMEIWSMTADGRDLKQHTHHEDFDVKGPSLGDGRIVYQNGADLWLYNIASGSDSKLDIRLSSDFDQTRERWVKKPMDFLTSAHLSPDGDRVVLTARGQAFVAPRSQGRLAETQRGGNVRYRDARFMPDGKSLLLLSDESGEIELWTAPPDGTGKPQQLTTDGDVLRWRAIPSPDGKWIAHNDKNLRLWLFNVETKTQTKIDESRIDDFSDLAWSPDSQWLVYVAPADNLNRQIKIHNVNTSASAFVTTDRFESYSPVWSPDGQWLYLLSDRHLESVVRSPWGPMQPEPFFDKKTRIYHVALKADARSPFLPADELHPKDAEKDKKDKDKEKEKEKEKEKDEVKRDRSPETAPSETKPSETKPSETKPDEPVTLLASTSPASQPTDASKDGKKDKPKIPEVKIDLDGLSSRLMELPLPPGNYDGLAVNDKRLFWISAAADPKDEPELMTADISHKDVKAKALVNNVTSFELSADGKAMLVRRKESLFIIDASASAPAALDEKGVDLSGWTFPLIPREEWRQMFIEAWRLERDYFYDVNMHAVDWKAMLNRCLPLVDRVSTRAELSDLISQMVGELSALHIFVNGGDLRQGDDRISPASLGAVLARDAASGGWSVSHIFRNDPDMPELTSPLAKPGVDVKEGDVIEEINGRATASAADPSILLRNQAGKQVLLKVKPQAGGESRKVVAVPISVEAETDLRYHEWEYTRRLKVDDLGKGEIGYVHLRAMGADDIAAFARGFYPVFNRKGLIVDVRHNRGGNIDSWVIGRLMRKAWMYWQPRVGEPSWNMQYAFRGHLVVLCNERTASDGEAFSEGIKRLKLGTVMGTRTWGGEIWLSSSNFLVDRGIATAAETGVYGPEGIWLIEGHGVDPDVVVDNPPHTTFLGGDAQLTAAIEYLQKKIRDEPVEVPKAPPHPDKAFRPKP